MAVKISCIIITLNEEKNLHRSLNAVNWCDEIIVVDGHQQESAKDAVHAAFKNVSRVHYIKGGGGASTNRNTGAYNAKGKILAFLDDDDLWCPEYLEQALSSLNITQAEAVITWFVNNEEGVIKSSKSKALKCCNLS